MKKLVMRIGIFLQQEFMDWPSLREKAVMADELGFDSFWLNDHLAPPSDPTGSIFEAWTAATGLLLATKRLRVGHMVICNSFRHPALLAKIIATLDVMSNGRVDLGIGSGSIEKEHHVFGVPFPTISARTLQLEESVRVMKMLFTQKETTFSGKYFNLQSAYAEPKPVQKPHVPIFIGGGGEKFTFPVVAKYADVWNCGPAFIPEFDKKAVALKSECQKIGRDFSSLRLSLTAAAGIVEKKQDEAGIIAYAQQKYGGWKPDASGFVGSPDTLIRSLKRWQERGVTSVMLRFMDGSTPKTLELFAKEVLPALQ